MKVVVEVPIIEGWSDKPSPRLSETVHLDWDAPAVPRVGEEVEIGYGSSPVKTVFWSLDGAAPLVRLATVYTLAETMETVMSSIRASVRNG